MSMNFERAAMRGKLAEAETNRVRLKNKFDALARSIRQGINTALAPAEEIEMAELSTIWSDLETTWAELLSTRSDIERLQKELS